MIIHKQISGMTSRFTFAVGSVLALAILPRTHVDAIPAADDPYTAGASGETITLDSIDLVLSTQAFDSKFDSTNLQLFLCRVALVETNYGTDANTYSDSAYHGGIWQVDNDVFARTQDNWSFGAVLSAPYAAIQSSLGIDWTMVLWNDLRQPVYSALAFSLYWCTLDPVTIPFSITEQANAYIQYYRPAGNINTFTTLAQIKGDPHMSQLIEGSNKILCYDVFGHGGDTYKFFGDAKSDITVSATLKGFGTGNKKAIYVGKLSVVVGDLLIYIDERGTEVDGFAYHWRPQVLEKKAGRQMVNIAIAKTTVEIRLNIMEIFVSRHPKCLNFDINHVGGVRPGTHGIIGDVGHRTQIIEIRKGAKLHVMNNNGTSTMLPLKDRGRCWKLSNYFINQERPFGQLLTGSKIDCLRC